MDQKDLFCVECTQPIEKEDIFIELKCGDHICSSCSEKTYSGVSNLLIKCRVHHQETKVGSLLDDIDFIEFMDNCHTEKLTCELHGKSVEYFARGQRKFACIRCLSQFMDGSSSSEDLVPVVSQQAVMKDCFALKQKVQAICDKIHEHLNKADNSADFVAKFIATSLDFINAVENTKFESSLSLFDKPDQSMVAMSTISNSKVNFSDYQRVTNLRESSVILQTIEDENFIRTLFEKRFDLALLFRASEQGFTAKAFHAACDNKGPTLCIFKSNKGKVFGGYSDKSWFSKVYFKHSKNTFLFSLDYKKKLKLFRNFDRALFFSESYGPCFGEDLMIGDKCDEPKSCHSFSGRAYETCEGHFESFEAQKALVGFPTFSLVDYEIYLIKFNNN